MERFLNPEDYKEPACPFCTDFYSPDQPSVRSVDLRRVMDKLDEHLSRNDLAAAERHLDYWKREAIDGGDRRGLLSIENERMGLLRKIDRREDALQSVQAALELVRELGLEGTVTAATTALNCATVYKTFGMAEQALTLYEQARAGYEAELAPDDPRCGGLYNNMALALADLGRYAQAREAYARADAIMAKAPNGALEQAITQLNLANLWEAECGLLEAEPQIEACLTRAERLLESPELPHNGYYAFVCEKCAPTFRYYGRFAYAQTLAERAEALYAGN